MSTIILIAFALSFFLAFFKLFPKAGRASWEGLIPGYNIFIALRIVEKPWWWIFLFLFPGINILMLCVISYHMAMVFNKRSDGELAQAAILPFYYLPKIGFDDSTKYVGQIDKSKRKKSAVREWGDAIIFAVVAATIIRSYFVEAFTIPTASMEKSLLRGDFLFVSKMSYGPKVPQTPLTVPLTHHSLPLSSVKSYLDWIHLPYTRLPGFGDVERNDVVVFNYPEGDTVTIKYQSTRSYNACVNEEAATAMLRDRQAGRKERSWDSYMKQARKTVKRKEDITVRPVDKREHYIKRCVGVPGDKLEVRNNVLYVNDEVAYTPPEMELNYFVQFKMPVSPFLMKENFGIDVADQQQGQAALRYSKNVPMYPLTEGMKQNLLDSKVTKSLEIAPANSEISGYPEPYSIYPNRPEYSWTEVTFGPIVLPKKGESMELNMENIYIYARCIDVYENNDLDIKDGKIFINGVESSSYTFQMNYYWMMGDNRHNSADSRFWGFVPEDHVVGKALFVWLSLDPELGLFDGKIRWDRMFQLID